MKTISIVFILVVGAVIVMGSPVAVEQPDIDHHWRSPKPILPMSFTHVDHVADTCVTCHHNYIDDTGDDECMLCHVNDERVAHLLREQFHDFCMGCHVERQLAGEDTGPVRRCIDCHIFDRLP